MTDPAGSLFTRIEQAPNLTGGLVLTLLAQIESGALAPGQRLPTEQAMVAATGVSRTVVREALASLRARGLVTTRLGLGAFVAEPAQSRAFALGDEDSTVQGTLRVLELRLGIEVEASGLAAARRTPAELAEIWRRLRAASNQGGGPAAEAAAADFAFHRSILLATHNACFTRMFDVIGNPLVARLQLALDGLDAARFSRLSARVQGEHQAMVEAIEAADPRAARRATHNHLTRSRKRLRRMLEPPARGSGLDL